MTPFGAVVRAMRRERKLTVEQLAKKVGTHKGYVSGWENGKVNPPSWKIVRKLAKALRVREMSLQLLAWAQKAPLVCRREMLKKVGWNRP